MHRSRYKITQGVLALVAVLFGLATLVAGTRVLSGSDPGYAVFRPLLIYNTVLGFVYVAAGVITYRSVDYGRQAAAMIVALNFVALCGVSYLYAAGSAVASDSLFAMSFRTLV